ncbi:MAG: hypothetical protein ACKOB6_00390 [Candidatus Kapaibacterium sp.]
MTTVTSTEQSFTSWLRSLVTGHRQALVVFILCALASRIVASFVFPTYDDAYITYRYAWMLVHHGQFVYNVNDWVLGTTAPLFGLFQALFVALSLPNDVMKVRWNAGMDIAIVIMLLFFCEEQGADRMRSWSALTVLTFLQPSLARISVGGMEVNTFAAMSLYAIILFREGRAVRASILCSIAYFLRPESVVLLAILGLTLLLQRRFIVLSKAVIAGATTVAVPFLVMTFVYGSFLPQSVLAKSHNIHRPLLMTLGKFMWPEPVTAIMVMMCAAGVVMTMRRKGLRMTSVHVLATAAVTLTSYSVAGPQVWSWYTEFFLLTLVFGSSLLVASLPIRFPLHLGFTAWCMISVIGMASFLAVRGPSAVERHVYRPIRDYCSANFSAGDSVLAQDIGIIGYSCAATIVDGNALVTRNLDPGISAVDKILRYHPRFILVNNMRAEAEPFTREPLCSMYVPVVRFAQALPSPEFNPPVLPSTWDDTWVQAYTLYRRSR